MVADLQDFPILEITKSLSKMDCLYMLHGSNRLLTQGRSSFIVKTLMGFCVFP